MINIKIPRRWRTAKWRDIKIVLSGTSFCFRNSPLPDLAVLWKLHPGRLGRGPALIPTADVLTHVHKVWGPCEAVSFHLTQKFLPTVHVHCPFQLVLTLPASCPVGSKGGAFRLPSVFVAMVTVIGVTRCQVGGQISFGGPIVVSLGKMNISAGSE